MNPDNIGEINELLVQNAAVLLDGADYGVYKNTRSGFTTSLVMAAERLSKNVLLISPTKRIIEDTMGAAGDVVKIYGNSACKYNQDEIEEEPLLKQLPMAIPELCGECKYAIRCCILDIFRNQNAPLKSMTCAKFEAAMTSDSERSRELIDIISNNLDVIFIDEGHKLVATDVAMVPTRTNLDDLQLRIQDDFPILGNLIEKKWHWFRKATTRLEGDIWGQIEQDGTPMTDDWLIREMNVRYPIKPEKRPAYWEILRKLAKRHVELAVTPEEVLILRDIIQILSQESARLSYISSDGDGKYMCVLGWVVRVLPSMTS